MAKEQEDLNKGQLVADPKDLNNAPVVTEQDLNAPGQGEGEGKTLADGDDESTKTVKYEEFKRANEAKKAAEEQLEQTKAQMAVLQANQQVVQPQVQTQPLSDYDQAKTDLGLAGEEYMDESQRSKVQSRMAELMNIRSQQSTATLMNQQYELSHSDFGSVVGLRNPVTGQIQPTAEILKIISEEPYLAAAAKASSRGAYEIVMKQRKLNELAKQNAVQEEHLKQQGIDTKLAPVSGAAAAGGAIPAQSQGVITIEQQQENERRVAAGELNQ